ncbi:hypothetical protein D041_1801B, partial [Vibrio parahaemolyticus EKP-008]
YALVSSSFSIKAHVDVTHGRTFRVCDDLCRCLIISTHRMLKLTDIVFCISGFYIKRGS